MGLLSKIKNVLVDIGRAILGKPSRKVVAKEKEIKGLREEISALKKKKLRKKAPKKPGAMWFVEGEQWVCDKSGLFPEPKTPEAEQYNCRWEVRKIAIGRGKPSQGERIEAINKFVSTFEPYSMVRGIVFVMKGGK